MRDSDGSFKVLEDNLQNALGHRLRGGDPRGAGRAPAAPAGLHVRSLDAAFQTLGDALRAAAPPSAGERPVGRAAERRPAATRPSTSTPPSPAAWACRWLLTEQLSVRRGRLFAHLADGEQAVDVVYRRTDEDRLSDDHGSPTADRAAAARAHAQGTLACVNAFGTGVADDKLVHAYVEDMVRFYLGEEPLLQSVPHLRSDPAGRARDDPRAHRRAGDQAARRPRRLWRGDRAHARQRICGRPRRAGRGARALRRAGDDHALAPPDRHRRAPRAAAYRPAPVRHHHRRDGGGAPRRPHTRRLRAGALVVNSSQNGGSKDTWVLA